LKLSLRFPSASFLLSFIDLLASEFSNIGLGAFVIKSLRFGDPVLGLLKALKKFLLFDSSSWFLFKNDKPLLVEFSFFKFESELSTLSSELCL